MVLNVLGLVGLVAISVFCTAMRLLCLKAQLLYAADSWNVTKALIIFIFLVPFGLASLVGMVAAMGGRTIDISVDSFGWSVLLLIVLAIPIIHLFVSTSRMKRAAEAAGSAFAG